MLELEGKFCKDCKIFTDNIEEEALSLIYELLGKPEFEEAKIRIMPDVHTGKGIVIGFTCPLGKYLNPDHVGCDIGCTVSSQFYGGPIKVEDYPLFEMRIKKAIPTGFDIHKTKQFEVKDFIKFLNKELTRAYSFGYIDRIEFKSEKDIETWCQRLGMDLGVFYKSIGTLGGGNHFMEYNEGNGKYAFTVHCGSRNLGQKVWKYWKNIADSTKISKGGEKKIIEEVKAANTNKLLLADEIKEALRKYKLTLHPGYLEGENMRGYLTDMVICQAYAKYNHKTIHSIVQKIYTKLAHAKPEEFIETSHNYIDFESGYIRKGAVRSMEGEKLLIPFNMRDGIAVCIGKSNPDWNYSAPHGCGRLMSRAKAKDNINLEDYRASMEGIYTTSIGKDTIDESPMAYKPFTEIIELIEPTCSVLFLMKPKINIKAGGEE